MKSLIRKFRNFINKNTLIYWDEHTKISTSKIKTDFKKIHPSTYLGTSVLQKVLKVENYSKDQN